MVEHTFKCTMLVRRAQEFMKGQKKNVADGRSAKVSKGKVFLALPTCQENKSEILSK